MALQIFLITSGLISFVYGAYCFVKPGSLDAAAGVVANRATGRTEIRSVFGGVQIGAGLILLLALADPTYVRPALLCLIFVTGGMGFARLGAAVLDSEYSGSTLFLIAFELLFVGLAIALL